MTDKKNTPKAAVAKKATTPKEKKQTPPVVNQPLASTSAPSKPAPSKPVPPKPAPSKPSAKPTPTTPSAKSTVSKKIRVVVHLFFYVITTGVIVSGCYFAWQSWQQQNIRMQKTQAQIEEQSIWFAKAMSQQSLLLEKQKQQLDGFKAALNNDQKVLQHRLDAQAKRLDALSGGSRDSWMLEEARYLLRLANQRQLTGGGALGIIGLLESADTLLRDVDAADVFPLRDSLSKDILALKITPVIDREGIYLQLSAVLAQIDQLPPVPLASALDPSLFTTEMPATSEATLDDIVDSGWQEKMWSSIRGTFSHLDNYFRIQHHDEALQPLLSAAEQKAILHSMRLMLEQAQSALLREEEKIYQHSLAEVVVWLNRHYSHFPEKQALAEQLITLQQQPIVSVLPTISATLLRLNAYISNSSRITTEAPAVTLQQRKPPSAKPLSIVPAIISSEEKAL